MFDFSSLFARFLLFSDHFLVVGAIAALSVLLSRWKWMHARVSDASTSVHIRMLFLRMPLMLLRVIYEEFLWRGPLLLLFASLTQEAWIGIVVSSVLFGAMHIPGDYAMSVPRAPWKRKLPDGTELPRHRATSRREKLLLRVARFGATTLGGVLFGYLVVTKQSLWWPIAAHMIWNMGFVAVALAATVVITAPFVVVLLGLKAFELYLRGGKALRKRMRDSAVG